MKKHLVKSVGNNNVTPVSNHLDSAVVAVSGGRVMYSFSEGEFLKLVGLMVKDCKEGNIKILRSSKRNGTFCLRHIHANGTVSVIGFAKASNGRILFSNSVGSAA